MSRRSTNSPAPLRSPLASIPNPTDAAAPDPNIPIKPHRLLHNPPSRGSPRKASSSRLHNAATVDAKCLLPVPVQVPYFEPNDEPAFWTERNVQVLIRIRPISNMEASMQGYKRCLVQETSQSLTWTEHPETRFTFDHVACESMSQERLFKVVGLPMVENCMSGYNSCMFAYGQTGSGKTYTMMGELHETDSGLSEDRGITPRIFEYLFTRIREEEEVRSGENLKYSCKCSFLEIYNEQITDLLEPSPNNLQLREDLNKGVHVENLKEHEVTSVKDVFELLLQGAANRKIAATHMNSESSRSHSVFTCVIESRWEKDSMTHLRFGRLNLVDLAGSERQKSSGAEGGRLKEAANINRSLSTLGLVIMTLVEIANGKHRHVPYRDSKLTFLLQDSLGGNSKTAIIANVSPSICSASETLSTLKFAQRAKLIQNNAKVNEDASGDMMALQQQIQKLKDQLTLLSKHHDVPRALRCPSAILEQANSSDDVGVFSNPAVGGNSDNFNNVGLLNQKINYLEATLTGALRREKAADTTVRKLEADIRHMNRLVHQREDDAHQMKELLRFREKKLKRLELLADDLISSDGYLSEENSVLSEEIQLLRERIDRNPELMQFALENKRLLEQLRTFQDFYQQGERETLLAEISHLRNQVLSILDEKIVVPIREASQNDDTMRELDSCRRQLSACLEDNARLVREIDDLSSQLKQYHSAPQSTILEVDMNLAEGNLEDGIDSCAQDGHILQIKYDMSMGNTVVSQIDNVQKQSKDARILVRAMGSQQSLTGELEGQLAGLQQHVDLLNASQLSVKQESLLWKTKYEELDNRFCILAQENDRLSNLVATKDAIISTMSDDWEKAIIELTSFLIDGWRSLEDASDSIGSVVHSFPRGNEWINEHVERAVEVFIEREKLIANLQKRLEVAQKMGLEMKSKLNSLKGATLAITEVQQLENDENSKELSHLRQVLGERVSRVQELEKIVKCKEDDFLEAEKNAEAAYAVIRKLHAKSSVESFDHELKSMINELVNTKPLHGMDCDSPRCETQYALALHTNYRKPSDQLAKEFCQNLQTLEERLTEVDANCSETKQVLLHHARQDAEEKTKLTNDLFLKFEEAQHTMEDAELILNALLKANEDVKHERDCFKQANENLRDQIVALTEEVQRLEASNLSEARHCKSLEEQIHVNLTDISKFLLSLPGTSQRKQLTEVDELNTNCSDIVSLGHELLQCIHTSRTWLEDIMSEILEKDFELFVLHQCHIGLKNEEMADTLSQVQHELVTKSAQIDNMLVEQKLREAKLAVTEAAISSSRYEMQQAQKEVAILSNENILLRRLMEDANVNKKQTEELLADKRKLRESSENRIISRDSSCGRNVLTSVENSDELRRLNIEIDGLRAEIVYLNDKLEMASALADENEAIAVEARQIAEASKIYAEEKEEEVKILEHSVEALEDTINMMENKVFDMKVEVENYQSIRKALELEVQALTRRFLAVANPADVVIPEETIVERGKRQVSRQLDDRDTDLCEARRHIEDLETEKAYIAGEIKQYREHISELVLHSEAQSSIYQEQYKALESMISEVKPDPSSSNTSDPIGNRTDKISSRARGSSSPFKCITSLVQQVSSEKDHELSRARLQIQELEALAVDRQKEICMLTARLAAVDSMTHDVIRDLLGVKIDMTNYANLIDGEQLQKFIENVQKQSEESNNKDKKIMDLKNQINYLMEERDSWIEEINQRKADILAIKVIVERHKQRDQLLTAQNEALKADKANLQRKVVELDGELRLLTKPQNTYGEENSQQRNGSDTLSKRLAESDKLLYHTKR